MKSLSSLLPSSIPLKNIGNDVKPIAKSVCEPDCPICSGLGWIRYERPISDPLFGRMEPCPNIDPFRLYGSRLGIEENERTLTWKNVLDYGDALRAVEVVHKTIERGYGFVYLWGGYGLAKSLILKIAVVTSIRAGNIASYSRLVDIVDHMRAAFDADNPSTESASRLDWWSSLPVLAIDEFDRIKGTEYVTEKRFQLMDRRYEQACRREGVTLMASNSNPATFEGYLADRILDGRFSVIELKGASVRPYMAYFGDKDE